MNMLKVLIVDDDDGDVKALRRLLSKSDYSCDVFEASRASDACGMSGLLPDIVLLDYNLPGEDGIFFVSDMMNIWPKAAIILISGQGSEQVAKDAILAGASDYISKQHLNKCDLDTVIGQSIQKAKRKWKTKEQQNELEKFSDVLVHDFRAPIRAVLMLVDQVREELASDDADEALETVELLSMAGQQMSELVDSLALYIKYDHGSEWKVVSTKNILDRSIVSMAQLISESRCKIIIEGDDLNLMCSAAQLSQLLQNLISNSIKYCSNANPIIKIVTRPLDDGWVEFRVSDNGIGIPPEYRERIFEPFKRVPNVGRPYGTGLGLATCRKIVERHFGKIWCETSEWGGSSFVFTLAQKQDGGLDSFHRLN